MKVEELRELMHKLHLDGDVRPNLIYVFYQTDDGLVNNFSISLHSARQRNRTPMTAEQLSELMQQYPSAHGAKLLALEHPQSGLTHWIDAHEVCCRLAVCRQTLRRWVKRGLLHPSRLGGRIYFDPGEIEAFLRSNVIQPNGRIDTKGQ